MDSEVKENWAQIKILDKNSTFFLHTCVCYQYLNSSHHAFPLLPMEEFSLFPYLTFSLILNLTLLVIFHAPFSFSLTPPQSSKLCFSHVTLSTCFSYSSSLSQPALSRKLNYFLMSIHSLQEGFKHPIPNTLVAPNKDHQWFPLSNPMHTLLILTELWNPLEHVTPLSTSFSLKLLFLDSSMTAFSFHLPSCY